MDTVAARGRSADGHEAARAGASDDVPTPEGRHGCPPAKWESDVEVWQWDAREDCEVRQILDRIADKWSLLAIALLDRRVMRFTELKREIDGISQRMLSRTLRQLERDGIVERTVYPTVPPRVDYALTEMGRSLHATTKALVVWTEAHQERIAAARSAYDEREASLQDL
ncbi:DNA-binding HxlR family transcriptional regulator [Cellulosimicrobium cellulans]|uniref:winged helix-turn-helix transcriptional regulator n=1 Tax=Cellulosimicrobium cellulans TaxID=1710 RepID=UPI0027DC4515|nr:helix-turn-helix domain-containing protein [Cellulosimicrobium cellulans]MBM7817870.1 DNA-binding HxlR family transcriptional regulator [Cellulosimicrobium cellulans]